MEDKEKVIHTVKVILKGLAPWESIMYEGDIYSNGAILEMKEEMAKAYIGEGIAYLVDTPAKEQNAQKYQEMELKTRARRKKAQEGEV